MQYIHLKHLYSTLKTLCGSSQKCGTPSPFRCVKYLYYMVFKCTSVPGPLTRLVWLLWGHLCCLMQILWFVLLTFNTVWLYYCKLPDGEGWVSNLLNKQNLSFLFTKRREAVEGATLNWSRNKRVVALLPTSRTLLLLSFPFVKTLTTGTANLFAVISVLHFWPFRIKFI